MLTESAMKHLMLFILCLFGVLSFSITPVIAGDHRSANQPNIVFILADDLGYGDVQCLNPERGKIPTPHMDQLAADGSLSCLLYTSPSPRDRTRSRMPSSA